MSEANLSEIEYGFNTADETINFGTRIVDGLNNLYETCTLAVIKSKEGDDFDTRLHNNSIIHRGEIFFSINNVLRIFSNLQCTDVSFSATFRYDVDTFCITSDGKYLLVCLRNGGVHCIKMEDQSVAYVWNDLQHDDEALSDSFFVKAFVENENDILSFIIALRNGKIFRIKVEKNADTVKDSAPTKVNFLASELLNINATILAVAFYASKLFISSKEIHIFDVATLKINTDDGIGLTKLFFCNPRLILGLNQEGQLVHVNTRTLTFYVNYETVYDDIILINDDSNLHLLGILRITSEEKEHNEENHLQLLSYPDFNVKFSLKMTSKIELIVPENAHDDIIYISKFKSGSKISELRFQMIIETVPENRMKRLLLRKRFDEAEHLAKRFGLGLKEINMARAQAIVDKVSCDKTDIDNLIEILNILQDDDFKIKSCLNVQDSCVNLDDVDRILKYGCMCNNANIFKDEILYNKILSLMFRFQTFVALIKCSREVKSVPEWVEFMNCNLIDEIVTSLEHRNIQESLTLFCHLDVETLFNLNEKDITKILNAVTNIPMEEQFPFLEIFIPNSLSHLPSCLSLFIKWLIKEVSKCEILHFNEFPNNAITFVNKVINMFRLDSTNIVNFQQYCTIDRGSLEEIHKILRALRKVQTLKNDYGFSISMKQFLQGKRKTLIETLLNKAIVKSIKKNHSLAEFIRLFLSEDEISPDEVYSDIIKDILKYSEEYWINVIADLLNLISSLTIKLKSILLVLQSAKSPWCESIFDITKSVRNYMHPLVQEIIKEVELESKSIILSKPEYGLDRTLSNAVHGADVLNFAIKRIIFCLLPTMVEDVYQICKMDNKLCEANKCLIIHFIREGENEKVLNIILNNNSVEETQQCCKVILNYATYIFRRPDNCQNVKNLQNNFYEVLKLVFKKMEENASDFQKYTLQIKYKQFTEVYNINKEFDLNITLDDVKSLPKKLNLVNKLVSQCIVPYYYENDIYSTLKMCKRISSYLDVDFNTILLQVYDSIGNFQVLLKMAEYVCENDCDCSLICFVVTLILKNVGPSLDESSYQISRSSVYGGAKGIDLSTYMDAIRLARTINSESILQCKKEEIRDCFKLGMWIQTTCFLMHDKCSSKISDNTYWNIPSMTTLATIRNTFELSRELGVLESFNVTRISNESQNSSICKQHTISNKIQMLEVSFNCFLLEGCVLTAYKLIKTLQFSLMWDSNIDENVKSKLNKITIVWCENLLQYVVHQPEINIDFAYCLLTTYDRNNAKRFLFDCLNMFKRNLNKFKSIAILNLRFLQANNIEEGQVGYQNIIHKCKWWNKIENHEISYDHFFKKPAHEVLQQLIEKDCMNIPLIEQFCENFNLERKIYYESYLKNYLLNWKPDYAIECSSDGKDQLMVKSDDNKIYESCLKIVKIIGNADSVVRVLNDVKILVNYYYYEVHLCILNLFAYFQHNYQSKIEVLKFLKKYTRVSSPGQTEIEEWNSLHPDSGCIDDFSKWRLPFTPTLFSNKIWNIIRPEINLKNYTTWFDAVLLLSQWLSIDDICAFVVKDIIYSKVFQTRTSQEWSLFSRHVDLLNEIDKCVQNISNLELATSTIYQLFNTIQDGADRVTAIKLCYKYALEYQKQHLDLQDVQTSFIKIEKKYFGYSTMHILHKNQLADKKYIDMIYKCGDELILELYMDQRILKQATFPTILCPDINKAVNELAELHNINIELKRKELLGSWLSNGLNFNNSDLFALRVSNTKQNESITSENLIRAAYLCTSDIPHWQKWLLKFGDVNASEASKNLNYKVNALKCFCNISNLKTIEELTEGTYHEFTNYINKLLLMSNLESFGFTITIDSLQICNKEELLKRLIYYKKNPLALQTMALICITFEINDYEHWTFIIKEMLSLQMFQELRECLHFLHKIISTFTHKKFYTDAWQAVINNLLDKATSGCDNYQFIRNFYVIQSCPILYSLNFDYIIKKYFEFKKYEFVALIIPFLVKEKQQLQLKEILKLDPNIYKKVEELSRYGFWSASHAKHLLINNEKE